MQRVTDPLTYPRPHLLGHYAAVRDSIDRDAQVGTLFGHLRLAAGCSTTGVVFDDRCRNEPYLTIGFMDLAGLASALF